MLPVWYVRCQPVHVHSGFPRRRWYMQSKCMVLPGRTAKTPDGSNAPDPMPILMRIDGGLSSTCAEPSINRSDRIEWQFSLENQMGRENDNEKLIKKNTFFEDVHPKRANKKRCEKKAISQHILLLPEKLVNSVVGTHDGIRGAHNPFEQSTRVSPSSLYRPKSLQRACSEWPCGTSHPTFFGFCELEKNESVNQIYIIWKKRQRRQQQRT